MWHSIFVNSKTVSWYKAQNNLKAETSISWVTKKKGHCSSSPTPMISKQTSLIVTLQNNDWEILLKMQLWLSTLHLTIYFSKAMVQAKPKTVKWYKQSNWRFSVVQGPSDHSWAHSTQSNNNKFFVQLSWQQWRNEWIGCFDALIINMSIYCTFVLRWLD